MVKRVWFVTLGEVVPKGESDLREGDRRVAAMRSVLRSQRGGDVTGTLESWTARVKVPRNSSIQDAFQAAEQGRVWILGAASMVGLPVWPVTRFEVVEDGTFYAEMQTKTISAVMGASEVSDALSISRQRLHQLRQEGRFPKPARELAATPLWLKSTVDGFVAGWRRRPTD
jgi:predicted DNA-binding transcriptional regulator AlpA